MKSLAMRTHEIAVEFQPDGRGGVAQGFALVHVGAGRKTRKQTGKQRSQSGSVKLHTSILRLLRAAGCKSVRLHTSILRAEPNLPKRRLACLSYSFREKCAMKSWPLITILVSGAFGQSAETAIEVQPGPPAITDKDLWERNGWVHPFRRLPR